MTINIQMYIYVPFLVTKNNFHNKIIIIIIIISGVRIKLMMQRDDKSYIVHPFTICVLMYQPAQSKDHNPSSQSDK